MRGKIRLKVGTRASLLARTQTEQAAARLKKKFPGLEVKTVFITTSGDKFGAARPSDIGVKGLFVKEIEEALLEGRIDFAVHSLKDMPSEIPKGLALGAITQREDPRDCLIAKKRWSLKNLPRGARIGTSSLRRQAQILALRPDVRVEPLRGNLDTRIRKLRAGKYDAIVVARAGVRRLSGAIKTAGIFIQPIPPDEIFPAVGQGSLAIEIRANDKKTRAMIESLNHAPSQVQSLAERAFLNRLQGGCSVPVGIRSRVSGKKIVLEGVIAAPSGDPVVRKKVSGSANRAAQLGDRLGKILLKAGGRTILDGIRR